MLEKPAFFASSIEGEQPDNAQTETINKKFAFTPIPQSDCGFMAEDDLDTNSRL